MFEKIGATDCTGVLDKPPVESRGEGQPPWFTEGLGFFPMEVGGTTEYFPFYGSGHIVGTHRMGGPNDSGTAVTDSSLRSYDHPNLFIMGTGSFPPSGRRILRSPSWRWS